MSVDAEALQITLTGLNEAMGILQKVAQDNDVSLRRANFRIGTYVRDVTRQQYAPVSPGVGTIRKATGRKFAIRKARGVSRPSPGGLERSIEFDTDQDGAEIYVAANAEAGDYAKKIHDEKGQTWQNRGAGTIAKGPKADDEFIVRAIIDHEGQVFAIIQDELSKAWKAT